MKDLTFLAFVALVIRPKLSAFEVHSFHRVTVEMYLHVARYTCALHGLAWNNATVCWGLNSLLSFADTCYKLVPSNDVSTIFNCWLENP